MPTRKAIPTKVKLQVTAKQGGYCPCGCREQLDFMVEGVDFDHDPPLSHRVANGNDWEPHQHDPKHIYALRKPCHAAKTPQDIKTAAKIKRLSRAQEALESGEKKTSKHNWPSKPIPKRADPWGREFAKARKEGRL